jgi:hypothetical protein
LKESPNILSQAAFKVLEKKDKLPKKQEKENTL